MAFLRGCCRGRFLLFAIGITCLSQLFLSVEAKSLGSMGTTSHVFRANAHLEGRNNIHSTIRSHKLVEHTVIFAIKQRNTEHLEDMLMDVSDPSSKHYGRHWTRAEVGEFIANLEGSKEVLDYLRDHFPKGEMMIEKRSKYDEFIVVKSKISHWEKFFATEFFEFVHSDWQNKKVHRALSYSLPKELDIHISSVGQVADFPWKKRDQPAPLGSETAKRRSEAALRANPNVAVVQGSDASTLGSSSNIDKPKSIFDTIQNLGKYGVSDIDDLLHQIAVAKTSNSSGNSSSYYGSDETLPFMPNAIVYGHVTPALLKRTYAIPGDNDTSIGNNMTSQAIYSTIGQTVSPLDLYCFQYIFGLNEQSISTSYHGYVNDYACYFSFDDCMEANWTSNT